jgi:hypothetical protein
LAVRPVRSFTTTTCRRPSRPPLDLHLQHTGCHGDSAM